ncbi:cation-translocating P-type ATPase, partial [Streptomyces sp. PSKA30]|nr:cation-translocating P-type ATPase [Streptomyces sp. PSKA30]
MIWPQLSSVLSRSVLPASVVPSTTAAVASTVRAVAQGLTGVPAVLPVVGPMLRPRGPRLWRTPGGVQIEVRRLGRPGTASAARELEAALRRVTGVSRAEVNGTLGCVYVGCGPETDPETLVDVVAAADAAAEEEALRAGGVDAGRPPVGDPGAAGARIGAAVRLGAGLVAVGVASVGNAVGLRGLPPVVISALQLVESMPPLREGLARRIGEPAAERGFAAANLVVTTLTYRPLGAMVAAVLAAARYAEVQARRTAWGNWARRLAVHEGTYRHDAVPGYERPAPLPPGPGERYANVAAPASLAAYGLTTLGGLGHDRALALLIAGTPRGPRFGREAFASSVGRAVSDRGALVLRPEPLRRLD